MDPSTNKTQTPKIGAPTTVKTAATECNFAFRDEILFVKLSNGSFESVEKIISANEALKLENAELSAKYTDLRNDKRGADADITNLKSEVARLEVALAEEHEELMRFKTSERRRDRRAFRANGRVRRLVAAISGILPDFVADDARMHGDSRLVDDMKEVVTEAWDESKGAMAPTRQSKQDTFVKTEFNDEDRDIAMNGQ